MFYLTTSTVCDGLCCAGYEGDDQVADGQRFVVARRGEERSGAKRLRGRGEVR